MFGFIERVVIPTLVIFVLVGGLGGALLGLLLVIRTDLALAFVRRMNRWVSTRRAIEPLEAPHNMERPSPRLRLWLGSLLAVGGALLVFLVLARLQVDRGAFVPGVDLQRWMLSGLALQTTKWFLVVGGAFSCVVGLLMLFSPGQMDSLEARMDRWYSSPRLRVAEETMHTPLEPRVEAHPRAAGLIIGAASLLVALGMLALMLVNLH